MQKLTLPWGKLAYEIAGRDGPAFLFVHNAGGNHLMMKSAYDHYLKKGRVISVDLRGHGKSDAPAGEYSLEALSEDIYLLCKELRLEKIIFIGLNYGANIGVALEMLRPELITHLIMIEPPLLMQEWIKDALRDHLNDLEHTDMASYAEALVQSVLVKASSEARHLAVEAFKNTPRHVHQSVYRHLLRWDNPFSFGKPALAVQTDRPFTSEEKLQSCFTNLSIGRVVGSGPWATLEVPEQVCAMIDRFRFLLDF